MNLLQIKMNPFKDINILSLDDKPLSPYSELNNYMKEPFLSWAAKLLEAAEREINDDFSLVVISGLFERLFLEDLQNDFAPCKEFLAKDVPLNTSVDERLGNIKVIANKYDVSIPVDECRLPLYTDIPVSIDSALVSEAKIEDARIIITNNKDIASQAKENDQGFIILLLSDSNRIDVIGNEQYVWELKEERLNTVLESILDRFVKTAIIVKATSMLKSISDTMADEDSKALFLATEIDPVISVADIPQLEVGETVSITIETKPETSDIPSIRIIPQRDSIIRVDGLNITAASVGTTIIDIYKAEENIPFERKTVEVFKNNLVNNIDLSLPSSTMGINKKQTIDIVCTPSDADDAELVEWSVDNDDIVSINENGEIISLREGVATIIASTKKATASVGVKVLPNIKAMKASLYESNLYVGQTVDISVSIEPKECFDSSYEWKTSDSNVAVVEKQADGKNVIRAKGIGDCVLTCEAVEGDCSTSCSVKVESTFKKRENAHGFLSLTALLVVACIFCSALSVSVAILPLAIAAGVFGILAMIKNKADIFWALILVVVAVYLALESMKITNII
ncbi:MAG: Ig-like domain-containing protein [Pseudobutyrivibrio sp.]|nr:Ig-like domain-containing protein [Pseudobutyrivibrio sp.]